jgi:hypothetical protein
MITRYELKQLQQFQIQKYHQEKTLISSFKITEKEISLPNNSKALVCATVMMISYLDRYD